jgi:hypothetical protein
MGNIGRRPYLSFVCAHSSPQTAATANAYSILLCPSGRPSGSNHMSEKSAMRRLTCDARALCGEFRLLFGVRP